MVALLTSVRNSPCFGGLRRTKTCHRQLFARPSVFLRYFLHAAKSNKNRSLFGNFRGFTNLESAHRSDIFAPQQLKPFYGSSEVPQTLIQRTKITTSCNPIKSFCRSAASSGGYAAFFVACGNRSPPLAAISSALRRYYVAIATFFLPPAAASFFVAAATNFAAF